MWWSGMAGLLGAIAFFMLWLFVFVCWWLGVPWDSPPVHSWTNYVLVAGVPNLLIILLVRWSLNRIDASAPSPDQA